MGEQMKLDKLSAARLEAHKATKARERITELFDEGTFVETDAFVKNGESLSGVITGYGEVEGIPVFAFSQDVEENKGAVGKAAAEKILKTYDSAVKYGAPVIGIYDSFGADVTNNSAVLAAYGDIMEKAATISGVIPHISLVLGTAGGVSALAALSADFVVMGDKGELFVTPPSVSGDRSDYGTAKTALASGVAHIVEESEEDAIFSVLKLVDMLPQNNLNTAYKIDFNEPEDISALVNAASDTSAVSMCDLVQSIVDKDSFLRLSNNFGKGAHTSLCTLSGYTVGMVATNGAIDHNAASRIARFVSVCDSFQIPVITLINTEGFKASGAAELVGAAKDMARLAAVYAEATTPKIALITGNATGAAAVALGNADLRLAWPGAVISAMPVSAAVAFMKGAEISADKTREQVENDYRENEGSVYTAAAEGYISDVIAPADTRKVLSNAIAMLDGKRVARLPKKHPNLPL